MGGFFDVSSKETELRKIDKQISSPNFWNDREKAQKIARKRSHIEKSLESQKRFQTAVSDAKILLEFAKSDKNSAQELNELITQLEIDVDEAETKSLLSGEHDLNNAICSVQSGAGGTDAQDWAQILMRMYIRWADKNGFTVEIFDEQAGGEAGIKSATLRIKGEYAYGLLSAETGVHRLVRISPFNSGASRETSFASLSVSPEIEEDIDIKLNEKDLRVDTYRATGAGGQHVNTTDSAVRITHIPSGIVVTCQNQRSQIQNRQVAMKVLRARLYKLELERRQAETAELEENKQDISFGSQIRNYVLHPYRLVKDTRTKFERSDVDTVLNGEIDEFIKEFLLFKKSNRSSETSKS